MTHPSAPAADLSHVAPLARAMLLLAVTLTIMAGTIIAPSLLAMTAHFQGTSLVRANAGARSAAPRGPRVPSRL